MHKLQQNETQNEIEKIRREINLWHDKLERSKKRQNLLEKRVKQQTEANHKNAKSYTK